MNRSKKTIQPGQLNGPMVVLADVRELVIAARSKVAEAANSALVIMC